MTSTTSGSTKYLYALADDGSLFRILLKDDGDLNSADEQFQQIPTGKTPTATYAKYKAKVKLVDGSNDEIIITGLDDHVVVLKKRQQGRYACCRAGLN